MAKPSDVKSAIAKQDDTQGLITLIRSSAKELEKALPQHLRAERLARIALTCVRTTPDLAKCSPASFMGALFTAAQIGIEPLAGRAYLLPFNNSRKINGEWKTIREVQFVLGYKGVFELFYRHSKAVQLAWGIHRENDDFDYEKGTNAYLRHKEARGDRGEVLGYWAMATLQGGGKPFEYWTREDCLEHGKKHSKTYNSKAGKFEDFSPWVREEDAMCLKTVSVQLAKLLPLSVEIQTALAQDEVSRDYRKGVEDILDAPVTTTWAEEKEPEAKQENGAGKESKEPENKSDEAFLASIQGLRSKGITDDAYQFILKQYGADEIGDPLTIPKEKRTEFLIELGKKAPKEEPKKK